MKDEESEQFCTKSFYFGVMSIPPIAAFWIGVKFRIMDEGETR
ncbi:hypothetical protein [Pectobacterium brasiliense]|nr:hypothetical protein [Pectobacterium brasiliense]